MHNPHTKTEPKKRTFIYVSIIDIQAAPMDFYYRHYQEYDAPYEFDEIQDRISGNRSVECCLFASFQNFLSQYEIGFAGRIN